MSFLVLGAPAAAEPFVTVDFQKLSEIKSPISGRGGVVISKGLTIRGGFAAWFDDGAYSFFNSNGYNCSGCSSVVQIEFPAGATDVTFDLGGSGEERPWPLASQYTLLPLRVLDNGVQIATAGPTAGYRSPLDHVDVGTPHGVVTVIADLRNTANFAIFIDNIRFRVVVGPGTLTFDLPESADARVLIHKYRTDDAYLTPWQTEDRKIQVTGTVLGDDGQPAAEKTVWFRLLDPPDKASYVVTAGDAHNGDNVDGPGALTATQATSDANGRVSTTLVVTDHVAGDNYQVEASTVVDGCMTGTKCVRSGTFTAWKRAYVEVNKMFRRGAFLTGDVPAGAKEIPVDDVRGLPQPPFEIRMLHAAKVDAPAAEFATNERITVMAVNKDDASLLGKLMPGPKPGTLLLDPSPAVPGLQRPYSGPEKIGKDPRDYLADAVGVLTGARDSDYYLPDARLVNALFDQAFVEYVWLTDATASDPDLTPMQPRIAYDGVVPYKAVVGGKGLDSWQREWLTRRWLHHADRKDVERMARPNHQALFTLAEFYPPPQETIHGLTSVGSHFNDTWLSIIAFGSGGMLREGTAHELSHQWRVNPAGASPTTVGGHCGRVDEKTAPSMIGQPALFCTMAADLYKYPEGKDGIVGFHYRKLGTTTDSEFLVIRRRPEPAPQNEFGRSKPQ